MLRVHDSAIAELFEIGSVECEDATGAQTRRAESPREPADKPVVGAVSKLPARRELDWITKGVGVSTAHNNRRS